MALYRVPIKWEQRGYLLVHAESQNQAAEAALNKMDVYPLDSEPIPQVQLRRLNLDQTTFLETESP